MNQIIFATHNKHKLREMQQLLSPLYNVQGLDDIGYIDEIKETGVTLKENASIKSKAVIMETNSNCFSDDTGLLVEALGGEPGVYSARYAGDNATYEENVDKLLQELQGVSNRSASFSTVISLRYNGIEYFFEGKIDGEITEKRYGNEGFGYDPVFRPLGYDKTFAEMSSELKNKISHRAIAVKKLIDFLVEEAE